MRARWLKPEFFRDRRMGRIADEHSMGPVLLYQALWVLADDGGVAPADPDRIKGELFFAWPSVDVEDIAEWLGVLEREARIHRYRVGDDSYCELPKLLEHQSIHKPSAFRFPRRSEDSGTSAAPVPESPGTPHILDTKTPRHQDTSKSRPAAPPDERVDAVLAHYRQRHPRRRPGNTKDLTAIRRALKQYTVEEIRLAIDGNAFDPWHAARAKHELPYVLRDSGMIDQFIALAEAGTPAGESGDGRQESRAQRVYEHTLRVIGGAG